MSSSNLWIAPLTTVAAPRVRLLCFPHGGGSATAFNAWPGNLPDDVEVCALQLPGRGRRMFEAPPTSIDQIVEALAEGEALYKELPLALFGHSFGAFGAFEFARRLGDMNVRRTHLFVAGQFAPHLPNPEPPIHHLPDGEFLSEVAKRYEGMPEEILGNTEMMELLLLALRADFTMKETYRYVEAPLLACPITVFGGCQDSSVSGSDLITWRTQTSRAFNLKMFPGVHFFIDHHRSALLQILSEDLSRT